MLVLEFHCMQYLWYEREPWIDPQSGVGWEICVKVCFTENGEDMLEWRCTTVNDRQRQLQRELCQESWHLQETKILSVLLQWLRFCTKPTALLCVYVTALRK